MTYRNRLEKKQTFKYCAKRHVFIWWHVEWQTPPTSPSESKFLSDLLSDSDMCRKGYCQEFHNSLWNSLFNLDFNNHSSLSSAHHCGSSCHSPESFCLHYTSQIKTASITSSVSCSDRNFQSVLWTSWNISAYCTIQKSQTTVYSCVKASFQFVNGLRFQCQHSPKMCQFSFCGFAVPSDSQLSHLLTRDCCIPVPC